MSFLDELKNKGRERLSVISEGKRLSTDIQGVGHRQCSLSNIKTSIPSMSLIDAHEITPNRDISTVFFNELDGKRVKAKTKKIGVLVENCRATQNLIEERGNLATKIYEIVDRINNARMETTRNMETADHEFQMQRVTHDTELAKKIGEKIITFQGIFQEIETNRKDFLRQSEYADLLHKMNIERNELVERSVTRSLYLEEQAKQSKLRKLLFEGLSEDELKAAQKVKIEQMITDGAIYIQSKLSELKNNLIQRSYSLKESGAIDDEIHKENVESASRMEAETLEKLLSGED